MFILNDFIIEHIQNILDDWWIDHKLSTYQHCALHRRHKRAPLLFASIRIRPGPAEYIQHPRFLRTKNIFTRLSPFCRVRSGCRSTAAATLLFFFLVFVLFAFRFFGFGGFIFRFLLFGGIFGGMFWVRFGAPCARSWAGHSLGVGIFSGGGKGLRTKLLKRNKNCSWDCESK